MFCSSFLKPAWHSIEGVQHNLICHLLKGTWAFFFCFCFICFCSTMKVLQWILLCISRRQNHIFNTAQMKRMITWKFACSSHTSVWETTAMYLSWSKTDPWPQSLHPPGTPPASPFACISHHSLCLQVACAILMSPNNVNIHSIWLLSYQPTFSLLFIVDFLSQSTFCYFLLTPPGSKPSLGGLILRAPMIPGRSQAS